MDTGKQHPQGIPVMDPRGATPSTSVPMAARPSGLRGVTLALVDNTKINAGNLLDQLSSLLEAEAHPARIVRFSKPDATRPAPPNLVKQITEECDAAVLAIGD